MSGLRLVSRKHRPVHRRQSRSLQILAPAAGHMTSVSFRPAAAQPPPFPGPRPRRSPATGFASNAPRIVLETADRVITRFITRSPRCPPLPSRHGRRSASGCRAGVTVRRSAIAGRGDRRRAARPEPRAELPVLDDVEPTPLRPFLRATRSDRPDRSAKPARRKR
jgi:hypothetical protein